MKHHILVFLNIGGIGNYTSATQTQGEKTLAQSRKTDIGSYFGYVWLEHIYITLLRSRQEGAIHCYKDDYKAQGRHCHFSEAFYSPCDSPAYYYTGKDYKKGESEKRRPNGTDERTEYVCQILTTHCGTEIKEASFEKILYAPASYHTVKTEYYQTGEHIPQARMTP